MAPKWLTDYYADTDRAREARKRRRAQDRKLAERKRKRALASICNDLPEWLAAAE
jgi:hypothetical protein